MNVVITLIEAGILIYGGWYGLRFKDGKLNLSPEKEAIRVQRLKSKNITIILTLLSYFCIFVGVILFIVAIWSMILNMLMKT